MLMLFVYVHLQVALARTPRGDRGQTTAEYALVLLGAAAVALVLVAWATKSGKLTQLFDAVIDQVLSKL
jgi:Flp pilus assembly pilin Flp